MKKKKTCVCMECGKIITKKPSKILLIATEREKWEDVNKFKIVTFKEWKDNKKLLIEHLGKESISYVCSRKCGEKVIFNFRMGIRYQ